MPLAMSGAEIRTYRFPSPPDMLRSEVCAVETTQNPVAVLVLCPGCNGDGRELIAQPVWQRFATEHKLGLVGISFASEIALLTQAHRGYYYASQGSGALLLSAVRKIYDRDLPLLLYGFSGGAHFTSTFVAWKPQRVITWCAYSAEWWDVPSVKVRQPAGILACGEDDERYGASLTYFLQGRALGEPWTWVTVPKTSHVMAEPMSHFVRNEFAVLLDQWRKGNHANGSWWDFDTKQPLKESEVREYPTLAVWLPNQETAKEWATLHQP